MGPYSLTHSRQAIEAALKFDPSTASNKNEPLLASSSTTGTAGAFSEPNSSSSASASASASASSGSTLAGKAPQGGGADGGAQGGKWRGGGNMASAEPGLLWWGVVGAGAFAVLGLAIGMAKWRR